MARARTLTPHEDGHLRIVNAAVLFGTPGEELPPGAKRALADLIAIWQEHDGFISELPCEVVRRALP